ncbi:Tetratricopeptide repeat protein [Gemmata sp. SH-PL17]|uniref:tetratricopeptide repeat protein n=1 Tax=Gemmata sp. SH-PL17 TaxID=1630693 RepID=UPI0004BABB73|nr:tetratricopeptide repeat protein [Gemmata sp. SH-PL17]AMV29624.1 Tetratricopeptide repeat protein [Gemmata sp. SH-PL17]
MSTRRPFMLFAGALVIAGAALALASERNPDLWSSPDQRADRLFRAGQFEGAAQVYVDPYRRGVALYRAGNFKDAASAFATVSTPEAAFDRGNSLVMLGKYDAAIASYDRALNLRANWPECLKNRAVAVVRRDRLKLTGGDETGGQVKADKIVFEKGKNANRGQKTEVAGDEPLNDEQLRGLWLRRVQTKPADFLRAKFAFQAQSGEKAP